MTLTRRPSKNLVAAEEEDGDDDVANDSPSLNTSIQLKGVAKLAKTDRIPDDTPSPRLSQHLVSALSPRLSHQIVTSPPSPPRVPSQSFDEIMKSLASEGAKGFLSFADATPLSSSLSTSQRECSMCARVSDREKWKGSQCVACEETYCEECLRLPPSRNACSKGGRHEFEKGKPEENESVLAPPCDVSTTNSPLRMSGNQGIDVEKQKVAASLRSPRLSSKGSSSIIKTSTFDSNFTKMTPNVPSLSLSTSSSSSIPSPRFFAALSEDKLKDKERVPLISPTASSTQQWVAPSDQSGKRERGKFFRNREGDETLGKKGD